MCGICGVYDFSNSKLDTSVVSGLKEMVESMKHRGPDSKGICIHNNCGLGNTRLSIINTAKEANQPFFSEDKKLAVVFNGEIYNFPELKANLEKKGHDFRTRSDTETLLKMYQEYGTDCLQYLRGMFAFAIYNMKSNEIFIARDRIGEKPLFYAEFENRLYFASELNAILKGSKCKIELDKEALHMYFVAQPFHVPDKFCLFNGIKRLEAGHFMIVSQGGIRIKRYWQIDYTKTKKTEAELSKDYQNLLTETVSKQMISDVPVCAFLSGGTDSSSVVNEITKTLKPESRSKFKTFTLTKQYTDPDYIRARNFAKALGIQNVPVKFHVEILNDIPKMIYYSGEPYYFSPSIFSFVISGLMKKEHKVALSGSGADEIFYGYGGKRFALIDLLRLCIPRPILSLVNSLVPQRMEDIKAFSSMVAAKNSRIFGDDYRRGGRLLRQTLYSKSFNDQLINFDEGKVPDEYFAECNSKSLIEKCYHAILHLGTTFSTTIIGDVTGMPHSLEIRAPFLDYKMIEFAASLPVEMKSHRPLYNLFFNKKSDKYIMKRDVKNRKDIRMEMFFGKKYGFGEQIDNIMKNAFFKEGQAFTRHAMFSGLPSTGLFNAEELKRLYYNRNDGRRTINHIMSLLVFWIWYEIYINGKDYREIKIIPVQKNTG